MPKVLIQFAHPAFSHSRVHKTLVEHCRGIKDVTFNDLYELYPDLYIDIKREKDLLLQHDILILQHPFYWYSGPAIIKQWLDLVLEYNWAYGPKGRYLAGKKMLNVISAGGGPQAYGSQGYNRYPVNQFLLPFRQTAELCHMEYLPPFVVYGTHRIEGPQLNAYAQSYANILRAMTNGELQPEQYRQAEQLNDLATIAN